MALPILLIITIINITSALVTLIIKAIQTANSTTQINKDDRERLSNMKYCSNCGTEINENAVVCVKCGCATQPQANLIQPDVPSTGLNVLSFLFPIVGLILYITMSQMTPIKAKEIGKWALIGFVVSMCLSLFVTLLSVL